MRMNVSFVLSCVEHHASQVAPVVNHARTSSRESTLSITLSSVVASILPISSVILFSMLSLCRGLGCEQLL